MWCQRCLTFLLVAVFSLLGSVFSVGHCSSVCVRLSRQQPFIIVAAQETVWSPLRTLTVSCVLYGHTDTHTNWRIWGRTQGSECFFNYDCLSHADPFSQNLLLSANSPQSLASDNSTFSDIPPCALTLDHEELVTMESGEYQQEEASGGLENDPLSDSGYIELHYYETHQYLVLPGDTQLDLETVEILQLDVEAQEAAGSLLDLAGGGY